jgi:tetratricopeptide (TPR) repeat protein
MQRLAAVAVSAAAKCGGVAVRTANLLPLTVVALLMASAVPLPAVVTFDLIHDTPESRRALKEEMAATPPLSTGTEEQSEAPVSHGELEGIWFARENFLQIGEREKARAQLDLLWEKQMERGVRNLPEYGEVLIREVYRNMNGGHLEKAEETLAMARRINPESLSVDFAAASLAREKNFFDLIGAGQELVQGAKAVQKSFRLQSWVLVNTLFIAFGALCLFFAGSVSGMLLGNGRRIAHDLGEQMPRRFSSETRGVLGWLLLTSPVLAGLPVWWWFIFGGLLVLPYVSRVGRVIVLLGAAFLLSLPWQVGLAASLLSAHRQPLLERVVAVRDGHWTDEDYWALKALDRRTPPEELASFSLGLTAKRMGNFEEAEAAYQKALSMSPDAAAWNNLGNLSMIGKDIDLAIERYETAIDIDDSLFAPHYNLSLAYREKFLFPEGEAASRRAVQVDPDAHAYYTSLSGTHFNRYTVDVIPQLKPLWDLVLAENKWQAATADHLWLSFMLVPSRNSWPSVVGGVLLLGLGWWVFLSSRGMARPCQKCGRVICSRCRGRETTICSQCHHIFVRKEGVDARVRVRKMGDIKRGQQLARLRLILAAVLLPGGGHFSAGRYAAGIFLLLPASVFLAAFFSGGGVLPAAWHLKAMEGRGLVVTAAAAYLFLWTLSLWLTLRLEE